MKKKSFEAVTVVFSFFSEIISESHGWFARRKFPFKDNILSTKQKWSEKNAYNVNYINIKWTDDQLIDQLISQSIISINSCDIPRTHSVLADDLFIEHYTISTDKDTNWYCSIAFWVITSWQAWSQWLLVSLASGPLFPGEGSVLLPLTRILVIATSWLRLDELSVPLDRVCSIILEG